MKKKLFVMATLIVGMVHAEIIELSYERYGDLNQLGWGVNESTYRAGTDGQAFPLTYRNFFTFNVSSFTNASSATLRINTLNISASGTFTLYDSDLTSDSSGINPEYADLGTGSTYGSINLSDAQDNQFVDIVLNTAALADINASEGIWTVGGVYSSSGIAFEGTPPSSGNMLIVDASPIPEPSTLAFVGVFAGGLFAVRRLFMI